VAGRSRGGGDIGEGPQPGGGGAAPERTVGKKGGVGSSASSNKPAALDPYFAGFKSLDQIFTWFAEGNGPDEARFAELAGRLLKDWQALQDTYGRWERMATEEGGEGGAGDSAAIKAAVRRAAKHNSGKGAARRIFKVVQNRPEVASIVSEAFVQLKEQGWGEMPSGHKESYAWNMLWTWSKPKIVWADLLAWQRVNHFPEAKQLTRKDNLKRHVQRFRNIPGKLGDLFDILPNTYTLPGDYVQFCTEFAKRHEVDAVRGCVAFGIYTMGSW